MAAPSSGPTIGATPATPAMRFIARTSRAPEVRSTTIERAITIAQPPAKPCTSRAAIITPMLGPNAHARLATASTASDTSSGGRRPTRSEAGPPISCPSAMPTKNVVNVNCTCVADAARSRPTSGNAGTYMSVASGAIAVINTIAPNTEALSATGVDARMLGAVRSAVSVICFLSQLVCTLMQSPLAGAKKSRS